MRTNMKTGFSSTVAAAFTLPFLLAACVTINVYFPEAAATQAADQVVCEIVGNCDSNASSDAAEPQALIQPAGLERTAGNEQSPLWAMVGAVLNATVSEAQAAASIDVDSPAC